MNSILTSFALIVILCLCSCGKDGLNGKYEGYYHPIERISLDFGKNSEVVGTISSTDFVGHFSDRIYGHYEYKHPHIAITWEKVDADNDMYTSVIPGPDSIIVNESLDTLRLYERSERYILPKYKLYHIDGNAPFFEQIGQYCYQTILLSILFILRNFFFINVIAIIIVILVMKLRKRRRN
mgnify:CR=1 FL=1